MSSRILKSFVALACFAASANALADCAADATVADVRASYAKAQQLEREGKLPGAFLAYVAAQEYTCDPNPVEADAARRAAPLAATLGADQEKKGHFEKAFDIYDNGGRYADADRALMSLVRANPDSPYVFGKARGALEDRALPAFHSNNKVRLAVTGAYHPDPKNLAEVLAMPAKGAERAFQKEAAAFNEQYLRELVQVTQSTPDDATDFEAMQAAQARFTTFAQKWPNDPIEASRDALSLAQSWASASTDKAVSDKIEAQRKQVLEQRVATLLGKYSGAPKLIDAAIDYQSSVNQDHDLNKQRIAAIKSQADKLGDEASSKQRLMLAAEYYSVAGQSDKAQAARDRQQQQAMARMQPDIDRMQKHAAELQKQYSDPEKIKAMQAQAEAMRKSLEQQQQANAKTNAKRADDLEKELGM
jgi:hypothetical protein